MNQKIESIAAVCAAALLGTMALAVTPVRAQDYPNKPIRVIVPFATGGMVDSSARVITDRLGARLGQQVLIENRGGAAGNVYDRLTLGYVVDFISLHYQDLYWPAFNVADSAICLGVGLLILDSFKRPSSAK